ncbi:gonadotropin subunit beta-1 isoform X1 [Fundulus heteroclitus]|uniref:gonadotropin subunit beta-1 isoform X1 n=1 Tax=Fundulus heteroclitus TaxID=8078 RepID=UPI00165AEE5A|nr:gonadotropin subunit beta-1 isoform X1 [Fundulus heteroclitus]XP_035991562.1 gonadotropin subunit beta-1 isoform X1 [Fundulus heteroclitus]
MQLVLMAAVLALAEVGCFGCRLKNVSIPMERCGQRVCIHTTICEGLCFSEDAVFESPDEAPEHRVCNGDWSYEVKHIQGCPESITYPVATNCYCSACNTKDTYCTRLYAHIPSC